MSNDPDEQPDPVEKSLGDQATGADVSRVDRDMSLGDQSTTGDALSSLSDVASDLGEAIDSDLPLIDLAARYEIEGELGQGGMGAVLLATDRQLKRKVAIKRILGSMSKSKTALQRFVTEAQSIAKLNHFNIVQVHEFGRDVEGPFLVLEYVGGGSLLDKLKEGKLEVEEAVDITCQLCDGLAVAHEQGIVHRDIKPANILLTERGEPKLTDFGLARQNTADHGQTQVGAVLGTIDFMPPEQRRDATAADARSDLWSLAATTYQMITGKSPKVIRLDQLPGNLAPVIGKMLEDNPDERYATAEEFKDQLRKGLATVATTVAADLAAGICPACNAANDASRKFCRGCGESLELECLACSKGMPVWENFCGQCGTSQQEERDQIRTKLSDTLEASLTLAREHEYEEALAQLKSVQEGQHAFTEDIGQQADKHIEAITTQRDEQYQLRDQLVELADQHQQAYDYAAEVQELEKIPAPLRTGNKIAQQLSNAQAARDELASLNIEIRDDVKNKRIEGLLEKATRFLELNPGHRAVRKLKEQLLQRQRKTAAIAAADKVAAEKAAPDELGDAQAYLTRGVAYSKKGDYDKAIADYTEAIRLDPNYSEAYFTRGSVYAEKKEFDKAITDFTKVIELDPTNQYACLYRGYVYFNKNEHDKAIADYGKVIELDPQNADDIYCLRGDVYIEMKQYDKAIADFSEMIVEDAEAGCYDLEAYEGRAYAYSEKKEYDKAIADLTEAMNDDPHVLTLRRRGRVYSKMGEYDKAIADLDGQIECFTEHVEDEASAVYSSSSRGLAYIEKGEFDKAIADFTKVIELDPTTHYAYHYRGYAYFNKDEHDKAIADYGKVIQLDPTDALTYNNRGIAYDKKGEFDKAIADFDKAIELEPTHFYAYHNRAYVYAEKGEYNRAIADYDKAIEVDPTDAAAYNDRGEAYAKNNDKAKADSDFAKAKELGWEPGR